MYKIQAHPEIFGIFFVDMTCWNLIISNCSFLIIKKPRSIPCNFGNATPLFPNRMNDFFSNLFLPEIYPKMAAYVCVFVCTWTVGWFVCMSQRDFRVRIILFNNPLWIKTYNIQRFFRFILINVFFCRN